MSDPHFRDSDNHTEADCPVDGCTVCVRSISVVSESELLAAQAERDRCKAALEDLLAHSTSDEYGEAGRLAARRAREALEGPADA